MTPQEKQTFEALVNFRHHCVRLVESHKSPVGFLGGLFNKIESLTLPMEIANKISGIDLYPFYADQLAPLVIGDRVQVNQTSGFSRGSKGVVKYITPTNEVWVERDGSGSDMIFHRDEIDLLV